MVRSGADDKGKESELMVGPVLSKGKDLPSGKNLPTSELHQQEGRMDLLRFYIDHKKLFPTLLVKCWKEATRNVVEVGCEYFFSLSGHVSAPQER